MGERRERSAVTMRNLRNRIINWVLVEKPAFAAKIIRKMSSPTPKKQSQGRARKRRKTSTPALPAAAPATAPAAAPQAAPQTPATRPEPLTRDNGLRAANIAAGVPGAE